MIRLRSIGRQVSLTISTNQTLAYYLHAALGYPTDAINIILTINSGISVQQGLIVQDFAAGSKLSIINNGTIAGTGGSGGTGNRYVGSYYGSYFPGVAAGNGGDAIISTIPLTITNASGFIYGGGGGGAGGDGNWGENPPYYYGDPTCTTQSPTAPHYDWEMGGGGGGGGQGYNNATGGAGQSGGCWVGDATTGYYDYGHQPVGGNSYGSNGNAGSSAGPGTGGAGGVGTDTWNGGIFTTIGKDGFAGNPGGAWGATGGFSTPGRAVYTNGAGIIWISGNDSTHVKGTAA